MKLIIFAKGDIAKYKIANKEKKDQALKTLWSAVPAMLVTHHAWAGDGTGFFSSDTAHCNNCCIKHNNKCHIEFITVLSDHLSDYKKNTYVFVKAIMQSWELYYVDEERKITTLSIDSISGLRDILVNQTWKSLSGKDKEQIRELISNHHISEYPEEKVTHYHNMFCATIVHPDKKIVLPLAPEPIMKTDGAEKNDCERNASRRLYADARREHPNLKLIVVEAWIQWHQINSKYLIAKTSGCHDDCDLVNWIEC